MDLNGKQLLISGANGALGRCVATRAAALGASLTLLDLKFEGHGNDGMSRHALDLRVATEVADCLAAMERIDAVFNIAGGFAMGPTVWQATDADYRAMFDINVQTMLNVVRAAVPKMLAQERGAIVNVGAAGALRGGAMLGSYAIAKNAVMRLTESLSAELKRQRINVNAVLPGVIDTPANRVAMPDADYTEWVNPDDLANAICFLGSDAARGIHGALLPVTGLQD